ncbi:hypothetical protein X975_16752, partial [Stegodyphus mimosarum]
MNCFLPFPFLSSVFVFFLSFQNTQSVCLVILFYGNAEEVFFG